MKTKTIFLFLAMLFSFAGAQAQTYVGTMEVDGYTRKEVEVKLGKRPQGDIILYMYRVKFARMMPVKIDVEIPQLALEGGRLYGNNIVPTSKGKPYEKFLVTRFEGTADSEKITFSCRLGDKPMKFSGLREKKNSTKNQ